MEQYISAVVGIYEADSGRMEYINAGHPSGFIISENAVYTPQNNEESSYAPMLNKELGKIDWSKPGFEIRRQVKGLKPWPMAYMIYSRQMLLEISRHFQLFRVNKRAAINSS